LAFSKEWKSRVAKFLDDWCDGQDVNNTLGRLSLGLLARTAWIIESEGQRIFGAEASEQQD
jgi:hypothetical protein